MVMLVSVEKYRLNKIIMPALELTITMGKELAKWKRSSQNENTGPIIIFSKKSLDKYICYNYIVQHLKLGLNLLFSSFEKQVHF